MSLQMPDKATLKHILQRIAPGPYAVLMEVRNNRRGQQLMESYGVPAITSALVGRYGLRVMQGPFEGMKYVSQSTCSAYTPKLVGSYESELHEIIEELVARGYDEVIDVGCAEGYYAVGMAMRMATARVHAFDINPLARKLCAQLAQENGVAGRVQVKGRCDADALDRLIRDRSLIICDCEGFEIELLDPARAPKLERADILVELHDCFNPEITPTLCKRFSSSHTITLLDTTGRDPANYPLLSFLEAERQELAVSEFRFVSMQWAYMRARVNA